MHGGLDLRLELGHDIQEGGGDVLVGVEELALVCLLGGDIIIGCLLQECAFELVVLGDDVGVGLEGVDDAFCNGQQVPIGLHFRVLFHRYSNYSHKPNTPIS